MTPEERALFEARAVLQAHVNLLQMLVNAGFDGDANLTGQMERVQAATRTYLGLPRPQMKQAA